MQPPKARHRETEAVGASEALAAFLRLWGRYAFDTLSGKASEIAEQCENWAAHVLHGIPADPAHPERKDVKSKRRKFAELAAFVEQLKRAEKLRVEDAVQTARIFTTSLSSLFKALRDEQAADFEQLNALLAKLQNDAAASEHAAAFAEWIAPTLSAWSENLEKLRKHQETFLSRLTLQLADFQAKYVNAFASDEIDMLTSLLTRSAFDQALERALDAHGQQEGSTLCLLIDLDHFGCLNEQFGHTAGDEVLRQISTLLRRLFPRKNELVARFGGEAFAVLLREMELSKGEQLAYQILDEVRQLHVHWEGKEITLTTSIAYAEAFDRETAQGFLSRIHCALMSAKRHRDCAVAG